MLCQWLTTKELLFLNLKFKTVRSDQLFYGQFQYSASFQLQECWVFRYTLDHNDIDERLTRQQEWRDKMRHRWPVGAQNRYHDVISDTARSNIHSIADFITGISSPYKLIIENKTMRIYSSDLNIIQAIEYIPFVQRRRYSQVIIDRQKNTIKLKKPKHCYRSYFRETRVTPEEKEVIRQFLKTQPDVRVGEGLKLWLDESPSAYISRYTRDYFFVDYKHASWLTMLALVRPGLIRKTVDIIAK